MIGKGYLGRIFVLIILIVLLTFGGLLWFDYLGLINTRSMFSPIYSLFGLSTPKGVGANDTNIPPNLDNDRYAKRLLALEAKRQELDKLEEDVKSKQKENKQLAEELADRLSSVEEKEKNFNLMLVETNDRNANIIQIANYMNGMRPENAVANLLEMDDQDIIDVLRAAEKMAQAQGEVSGVANWFSLMPPARAAEIQRKMANKPVTFP